METPFFGGTYQSQSPNLADNRCMNLYPEVVETKEGKQIGGFYSTPGLRSYATVTGYGSSKLGPIRGVSTWTNNKTLVVACGNQVSQFTQNGSQSLIGNLKTQVGPVSIINNGSQLFVCDGMNGWSYAGGTWAQTSLVNPQVGVYQDGFGLVTQSGTNQFFQSNLNDLTTWPALQFSSADSDPSPIYGMVTLYRQLWIFKQNNAEIWNNAGLNNFAFQRMAGAYLEQGCLAPYSIAVVGDRIMWLGQDDKGQGVVYINQGYSGMRVSTHAVEYAFRQYPTMTDAVAYAYQQAGHIFYVLSFPRGNATWVFDLTTQLWHERGEFLNGAYAMHDSYAHALFYGQNIVGSASGPYLYSLDLSYATDDLASNPKVNPKRWFRRWRALKRPVNSPVRLGSLKVDMQTGINVP